MNQQFAASAQPETASSRASTQRQEQAYSLLPFSLFRLLPYVSPVEDSGSLNTTRARREFFASLIIFFNISLLALWPLVVTAPSDSFVYVSSWVSFLLCAAAIVISLASFFQISSYALREAQLRPELLLTLAAISLLVAGVLSLSADQVGAVFVLLSGYIVCLAAWRYGTLAMVCFLDRALDVDLRQRAERVRTVRSAPTAQQEQGVQSSQIKPLSELVEDEIVLIQENEFIPCDGEVLHGAAEVFERRLNAGAERVVRFKGQQVFAGSQVLSGSLYVRVISPLEDSQTATLYNELHSRIRPSDVQIGRLIRFYKTLPWAIVFIACCVAIYWRDLGATPEFVFTTIASVLSLSLFSSVFLVVPYVRALALRRIFSDGALLQSTSLVPHVAGLRSLVIAYEQQEFFETPASNFELIDARVDRGSFISAVIAILSASKETGLDPLIQHLREQVDKVVPYEAHEVTDYDGVGISATVAGAEFSIGVESFLVQRGVHLHASDVGEEQQAGQWIYFAVGQDVIARVLVGAHLTQGANQDFQLRGLQTKLCSLESAGYSAEQVDKAGKELGLELAHIHSNLKDEEFLERLSAGEPAALLCDHGFNLKIQSAARVVFTPFEELFWNISRSSVVLFGHRPSLVKGIIQKLRSFRRMELISATALLLMLGLLLCFGVMGYLPALTIALSIILLLATLVVGFLGIR